MNRSSNITHDHTYHFTKQEESIDSNSNNIEEQTGRPDTNNITDGIMENINHLLPTVLERMLQTKCLLEFHDFFKVIAEDRFPIDNISFRLFLETV